MAFAALAATGGCSVGDQGDESIVAGVTPVEWDTLPKEAQEARPPLDAYGRPEPLGVAVVLPGSEARKLLIAVWGNMCRPVVGVSGVDVGSGSAPQLNITIAYSAQTTCEDALWPWAFEVHLTRDVEPGNVVLVVADSRSS